MMKKMELASSDLARTDTIFPLSMAAVYAWAFTYCPPILPLWLFSMLIPVGIAAFALAKCKTRYLILNKQEAYCQRIEGLFFNNASDWGWESYYHTRKPKNGLKRLRLVVFRLILVLAVGVAIASPFVFPEVQQVRLQVNSGSK